MCWKKGRKCQRNHVITEYGFSKQRKNSPYDPFSRVLNVQLRWIELRRCWLTDSKDKNTDCRFFFFFFACIYLFKHISTFWFSWTFLHFFQSSGFLFHSQWTWAVECCFFPLYNTSCCKLSVFDRNVSWLYLTSRSTLTFLTYSVNVCNTHIQI